MTMKRTKLFGFDFIAEPGFEPVVQAALDYKAGSAQNGELPLFTTPNVDQLVKLARKEHAGLSATLRQSMFVLPDGQPIVWTARLKGRPMPGRLPGSDFFVAFWKELKASDKKVVFIIANPEFQHKLSEEKPRDTFFFVPPIFSLDDDKEKRNVLQSCTELVTDTRPDYVMIGLGFPKQETIALHLIEACRKRDVEVPLMFLLGASFEFYVNPSRRAPRIWQRMGLEWFHRFLSEPGRMFKRYFVDDLAFLPMMVREVFKKERP